MKKIFATICLLMGVLLLGNTGLAAAGGAENEFDYTFKMKGLKEGDQCLLA